MFLANRREDYKLRGKDRNAILSFMCNLDCTGLPEGGTSFKSMEPSEIKLRGLPETPKEYLLNLSPILASGDEVEEIKANNHPIHFKD